jgi:polyferredoxin
MGKLFVIDILVANIYKSSVNQFMMFNILERRFTIFLISFWPQDFYLFVLFMIIGIVFVILLRLFLDVFFADGFVPNYFSWNGIPKNWILIEGDRGAQIRLHKQEWNAEKIRKKAKMVTFLIISFFIANVFGLSQQWCLFTNDWGGTA